MTNITVETQSGHRLSSDWRAAAPLMAQQATTDYMTRLCSAWKQPLAMTNQGLIANARLEGGARHDALELVVDDDQKQVWEGPGVVVRKYK